MLAYEKKGDKAKARADMKKIKQLQLAR